MNPEASTLWPGPRWALALLLACLGMLGPFCVDTYLPAFDGIAASVGATPVQMQQTLSSYLLAFAVMNLFHGALSDSLGRRGVVLAGVAVFTLASVGCALSSTIGQLVAFRALQGASVGAGMVVSRAVIRDMFPPADAQRVMSQVTLYFGIAPAVAPLMGGLLFEYSGWHAIFWLLAAIGVVLWAAMWRWLPETLHEAARQPFEAAHLLRGYAQLLRNPRFVALVLASAVPFNGLFVYILSAPAFLGRHLQLAPGQFFWFFICTISGIMGGAWLSGRLAGRVTPRRQIRLGFIVMGVVTVPNLALNLLLAPHVAWAVAPLVAYAFGWSLMTPAVTLLALDQAPQRRGTASSVQSCAGSLVNAAVAGVVAPLAMGSTVGLAAASAVFLAVGAVAWAWVRKGVGSSAEASERPVPAPGEGASAGVSAGTSVD